MKLDKEFKEAISNLPSKEKDKLLFRLLKKDLNLFNRLRFELLDTESVDDKRKKVEKRVEKEVDRITENFYSPGYLHMDMRYLSGEINDHVGITKDKFGEVSLNILMLIKTLKANNANIMSTTYGKSYKCCIYIIARAFKILLLIDKLHDDYFLDLESGLKSLGKLIASNDYLMRTAINNGLDVNWLILGEIPEDIVKIHRDIRERGFLK